MKITETSNEPPSFRRRFLAKALPVFVFGFFFPALLFIIPKFILDRELEFSPFLTPLVRALLGGSLIILSVIVLFGSIRDQRKIGEGTPMPLMATKTLVSQGLYSYCRNPIYFGVISLFFGISILFDSISSLVMVLIFSVILLLYARFIEEKELEQRFGDSYLAYKGATPFFIPTPPYLKEKKMKATYRKIAAVLTFIIGAMAIFAGGQVLLGKVMDYYVIDWLPVYNFIAGLVSAFITAILVWKGSKFAMPAAIGTFASHGTVMLILQIAYRDLVAPDSVKAMTVRLVVWLIILSLMIVQVQKDKVVSN